MAHGQQDLNNSKEEIHLWVVDPDNMTIYKYRLINDLLRTKTISSDRMKMISNFIFRYKWRY